MSAISTLRMRITYPETFKHVARQNLQNPGRIKKLLPCLSLVWERKSLSVLGRVSEAVQGIAESDSFYNVSSSLLGNQLRPIIDYFAIGLSLSFIVLPMFVSAVSSIYDVPFYKKAFLMAASLSLGALSSIGGICLFSTNTEEGKALGEFLESKSLPPLGSQISAGQPALLTE